MAEIWDKDYNDGSVDLEKIWRDERLADRAQRAEEERRSTFEVPHIPDELIREQFISLAGEEPNDYDNYLGAWKANRTIWICHDCGCIGYKYSRRELFKCNSYNCRSRNVTVCRAGELSMLIRGSNSRGIHIGVHMQDIYNARKERLHQERMNRRNR